MQVANGYHRVCAYYHTNENIPIPTKVAAVRDLRSKAAKKSAKSGATKSKK
jgi:hypothetical protein